MAQLGLDAYRDGVGNAVGIRERPNATGAIDREIVLLGHIDTVPGEVPVRLEGGVLYGRGTVDAKGPLATFVMAAARTTLQPGTRLVVIGAVEEEAATSRGARYAVTQYAPDFCIIGEPSGWDGVTLGYKGRLLIDYELIRPLSHTAGAEPGSAERAIEWYNGVSAVIADFNRSRSRLFDQLLLSIRQLQRDSDGLTDRTRMKLGVRLPPQFAPELFEQQLHALAGDATVRCYGHEAAYQSDRRNTLVRAFIAALRQTQATPRFKLKTGTSDMNVVGPVWQCPMVAFGPGDSRLDHTPDEHILLEEYCKAIDVLTAVLSHLQESAA
jgi:LysW-gamma-L-lysine carboxypeptidase